MKNRKLTQLAAMVIIASTLLLGLVGCGSEEDEILYRHDAGVIREIEYMRPGWASPARTIIKTTKATFVISGNISVPVDVPAESVRWSNDKDYLTWEGETTHYFIH